MTGNLEVIFVHGAYHNDTCWDLVRGLLQKRGIRSVALQLPMTTLDEDAAVVRAAIDAINGECIVVSHSWGGSPVTMGAAGSVKVRHLIYLCAFMIEAGQPVTAFDTRHAGADRDAHFRDHDKVVVNPAKAVDLFYHDVDPTIAAACVATLRPFSMRGFDPVPTDLVAAWKTIPSTYIVTTQDRAVHPEDQRLMARNANETVEINTSHSPFLSRPDLIASLIEERYARVVDGPRSG